MSGYLFMGQGDSCSKKINRREIRSFFFFKKEEEIFIVDTLFVSYYYLINDISFLRISSSLRFFSR